MQNEYDYKMLNLRAVCLNFLYVEDMTFEGLKGNIYRFAQLHTKFGDDEIALALDQLETDNLISKIYDKYHIEEQGKETRLSIIMDYLNCNQAILNSFGFENPHHYFK